MACKWHARQDLNLRRFAPEAYALTLSSWSDFLLVTAATCAALRNLPGSVRLVIAMRMRAIGPAQATRRLIFLPYDLGLAGPIATQAGPEKSVRPV